MIEAKLLGLSTKELWLVSTVCYIQTVLNKSNTATITLVVLDLEVAMEEEE